MAIPTSVTNTSIESPGVITVVTSGTTVAIRPRTSGAEIMVNLAVAASWCPPIAPRIVPSEPDITLTLNLVSISKADKITTSKLSTTAPLLAGSAYHDASISC